MTDSIPITELTSSPNTRRDHWGRYMVVPPAGGEPVPYTRVTTVAKVLDSMGGLAPWKATMACQGVIHRPGLRARWEALLAEHPSPWYGGEAAKAACRQLVEDCATAGGADDAREVGSALHALTALVDIGVAPRALTAETAADLAAYTEGMAAANVTIIPGMVERTVVLDHHQVAGTFDRLVKVPGFDLPLVADLKTGSQLEYAWQTIAVQLAAYSRADALYVQGAAADGSDDRRETMPYLDPAHGLVMWLPQGEARLELWLVDLHAGWDAFGHSMWARGWSRGHPEQRLTTVAPADPELIELLEQSIAQVEDRKAKDAPTPLIDVYQPGPQLYRDWLQGRIDVIGAHKDARKDLAASWPDDTPTLRAWPGHSTEQLDLIETLLVAIEARYGIPFPPPRPGTDAQEAAATAIVLDLFPGATSEDATPNTNP